RKRGRKSAAELSTPKIAQLESVTRQFLPPELRDEEAEVFLNNVNAMPAEWVAVANAPLLTQDSRHVVAARRLAGRVEKLFSRRDATVADYSILLKEQRAESAALSSLAAKMRLSQSAIRNDRGNQRPGRSLSSEKSRYELFTGEPWPGPGADHKL